MPDIAPSSHHIPCPCNPIVSYQQCCQPYHAGKSAASALLLMRSRYSAYVFKLEDYLFETWHPQTRPKTLNLAQDGDIAWLGLTILDSQASGEKSATVEFIAEYQVNAQIRHLHETSRFIYAERWLYVDGEFEK